MIVDLTIKKNIIINSFIAFLISIFLGLISFKLSNIVPFGNRALTCADANIQYLDFFEYLRNILCGKEKIGYTLNNGMGGDTLALFSYYLASPLNLLVIFFKQQDLKLFFSILVLLKLALSALTANIYLNVKFENKIDNIIQLILSISYAFMQYNIAQSSNIMWLDGVILLPLIMLGIDQLLKKQKIQLLAITVGCSILFNWYTGGINCLFAIIYFFCELLISNEYKNLQKKLFAIVGFGVSMFLGLMISAVLFLPSALALLGGKGSKFDTNYLKNIFDGNILSLVENNVIGGISNKADISIFCGSLILLGVFLYFTNKKINATNRIIVGLFGVLILSLAYWRPADFLFSLLKLVTSYWCRYSYIMVAFLLFIAGMGYARVKNANKVIGFSLIWSFILLLFQYTNNKYDLKTVYDTCTILVLTSICIFLYMNNKQKIIFLSLSLLILSCIELGYNSKLLLNEYSLDDVDSYKEYVVNQQELISSIEKSNYRIKQTSARYGAFNLNEALSYNYWSTQSYTSCPDNNQLSLLDNLGYRLTGHCTNIDKTSIIPADSFLNVKYILSKHKIKGLKRVSEDTFDGKGIYENPYFLPMSYLYTSSGVYNWTDKNPFEYQNCLYSELVGKDIAIFKKAEFEKNELDDKTREYIINIPNGNFSLYGNLPWKKTTKETITFENGEKLVYSSWGTPSVFYIPFSTETTKVLIHADNNLSISEEQFYYVDLDLLKSVTDEIKAHEAKDFIIDNNIIKCTTTAKNGESLIISVPYTKGWSVQLNNECIEPNMFGGCFISIPLTEGNNDIIMKYKTPGLNLGICVSIIGVFALLACLYIQKRWNSNKFDKIRNIINTEWFRYIIIGGCTTLVNFIFYGLLCYIIHINVNVSNVVSIIASIVFAYITNKIFVFKSKTNKHSELIKEMSKFVGGRLFTMILEVGGVFFLYSILGQHSFIAKLETQIIVLITNYIISKFFVFKGEKKE
ncbi:MAG: YfhO family protein [Lachnospiraceae bacterium]|nr:YfhO family protein [Lachnospiraceae bacterium]